MLEKISRFQEEGAMVDASYNLFVIDNLQKSLSSLHNILCKLINAVRPFNPALKFDLYFKTY